VKRLALSTLLAVLTLAPASLWAWSSNFPVEKVYRAVVFLHMPDLDEQFETQVGCTGTSLGNDFVATANHCAVVHPMEAYGKAMQVVEQDEANDIAILRSVGAINIPAFKLAPLPKPGADVMTLGFLGARHTMTFFPGTFQTGHDAETETGIVAGHAGNGMSGSPVIDTEGRLVSIHLGRLDPTMQGDYTLAAIADYSAAQKLFVKYTTSRGGAKGGK